MPNEPLAAETLIRHWHAATNSAELSLERREQIIDEELRAICFSDPKLVTPFDEILLWSHYANGHRGFRIGFEFPETISDKVQILPMTYEWNRPVAALADFCFATAAQSAKNAIEKSARFKSRAWIYEHEVRLFTKTRHCKPRTIPSDDSTSTEQRFFPFEREWVKSVDFGARCPNEDVEQVLTVLKTDYPKTVARRRADFHQTEYALKYGEL